MDFFRIKERAAKIDGVAVLEIYPDFQVLRTQDLMIRGRDFYAVWDEAAGLWSTDEYDVQRLVDAELREYAKTRQGDIPLVVKYMGDFSTGSWRQFRAYLNHLSDSSKQLDENLTFLNTEVKKSDCVSRRLPYSLEAGSIAAYQEMFQLLYAPDELAKLEWAIGAIISGDSKSIQKLFVLYGSAGTGKSTWMNMVQDLFEGYYASFEAKALTSNNGTFSMSSFANNPLVAIQHDGDLSKIEDNTKLNSIVSHEMMQMNEKYKPPYDVRLNAFLFMGTNKPVKITDSKSGMIRRLIDVHPTGEKHNPKRYHALLAQMHFELGAIAHHCLEVYRTMGKHYYEGYRPVEMMLSTDIFFNFIEAHFDIFKEQDGVSLVQAWALYKAFCTDSAIEHVMPRHRFRDELANYFETVMERAEVDGQRVRNWYSGFKADKFKTQVQVDEQVYSLVMEDETSLLDDILKDCPAQLANTEETPNKKWVNVKTTLKDIDTSKVHYVKVPENHIVIDFDLKGEDGQKSLEKNLEAASQWPPTYAEHSKGGSGVHLHYRYTGEDVNRLSRLFEEGVEIKVFAGDSSLRRRLTRCNNVPVADISSGLPLKEKKMLNVDQIKSEKGLRELIMRNLRKEIHPSTKPSVDFIHKILEEAYASGMQYDVTDMRGKIFAFANNSSNQALECIRIMNSMKFASEPVEIPDTFLAVPQKDDRLVLFDVEVFPNLFVICWKFEGDDAVQKMVNPKAPQVESLFGMKLVGFNNRRYDNHILYGAFMGYSNKQIYELSQMLICNSPQAYFAEAYNLSYADLWDIASKKQTLKKWQIELGILHRESPLPWTEPVPPEKVEFVVEYCANDVESTDAVLQACRGDFIARQILADLSGLPVNASTQQHTAKIVFGDERRPQKDFVYTNLADEFPGYKYELGKSYYRDEMPGEGGYVYAEPGMYENVALLDVASMHPTTIERLNLFGVHTRHYSELKEARLAIKRGDYATARKMFGGRLVNHLQSEDGAEKLSYALKIVVNIVYGLTAARFDNMFKDPRNIDNIVAKRGALFMIDLKHAVQEYGFKVVHIKTDSIKIANATPEIIRFVTDFGKRYGYDFEHEATYSKLCLVNDAVYVAKSEKGWTAVGAQFQHPYVFKTLFSGEPLQFRDFCETKTVTTALYLDFDSVEKPMYDYQGPHFVGKAGMFVPVTEGGGLLLRSKEMPEWPAEYDDKGKVIKEEGPPVTKYHAAPGTKGYLWLEASSVKELGLEDRIDMRYFEKLVADAKDQLGKYGDQEQFLD